MFLAQLLLNVGLVKLYQVACKVFIRYNDFIKNKNIFSIQ